MEKNKKEEEFPSVAASFEEVEYEAFPEEQKEKEQKQAEFPQGSPC